MAEPTVAPEPIVLTKEQIEANKALILRNSRQEGLIPADRLKIADVLITGIGAVGRSVALQLAAIGVKSLTLYDPDHCDIENLCCQNYRENQVKKNKAETTAEDCVLLNKNVIVKAKNRRFAKSDYKEMTGKYCFFCVDTIDTRKNLYESSIKAGAAWIGDGRVAGEVIRVIAEDEPKKDSKYGLTIFPQSESYSGSCHAKMTAYSSGITAGMLVSKFAQNIRGASKGFSDHSLHLNGFDLFETPPEEKKID